jgi:hypothetical protein
MVKHGIFVSEITFFFPNKYWVDIVQRGQKKINETRNLGFWALYTKRFVVYMVEI